MEGSNPAKLYAGVVGAALTIAGIVGYFYNADFTTSLSDRDALFGLFDVNGWNNTLHLLTGLLGLVAFMASGYASRTYALVVGVIYLFVAIWGFIIGSGDSILSLVAVNTAGNFLHLALGLLGLAATRMWRVTAIAVAAGLFAVLIPGVATADNDDQTQIDRGREAFVYNGCSNCHTLAQSGSLGTIGPNLDEIKPDRNRVLNAIKIGGVGSGSMPQGLASGDVAKAIADYVATATGGATPLAGGAPAGGAPAGGAPAGKQIFSQNCGSCHTLAAAGTSGTIGPNLDQVKPNKALVLATIKAGRGVMPPNIVTGKDAQEVADYVSSVAGKK